MDTRRQVSIPDLEKFGIHTRSGFLENIHGVCILGGFSVPVLILGDMNTAYGYSVVFFLEENNVIHRVCIMEIYVKSGMGTGYY